MLIPLSLIALGYTFAKHPLAEYVLVVKDLELVHLVLITCVLTTSVGAYFVILYSPLASIARNERASFSPANDRSLSHPRYLTAEAQLRRRGSF